MRNRLTSPLCWFSIGHLAGVVILCAGKALLAEAGATLTSNRQVKLDRLIAALRATRGCLIAYSGGADSTLLLSVAADALGDRCVAATARSLLFPENELRRAVDVATNLHVPHVVFDFDQMGIEQVVANSPLRCYHCKQALAARLWEIARAHGLGAVADGGVVDDAEDYRPGRQAALEAGIISPMADAGLTKADVAALSDERGLLTAGIGSMACYASRIPYGTRLDEDAIRSVAAAEAALVELGFPRVRVRHHGDVARVELPPDDIERAARSRRALLDAVRGAGYAYVALDLEGYRTGSMNERLAEEG